MTTAAVYAEDLTLWEDVFVQSIARELDGRAAVGLQLRLDESRGIVTIESPVSWQGPWDVSPGLIQGLRREGAWIVVVEAKDLDDRIDALLMETAHAASLRGRTMRLVTIGKDSRHSRAVHYSLPELGSGDLMRLVSSATAVLCVERSSAMLSRLAARAGIDAIGIGPGSSGDRVIASYSNIELAEALENRVRKEPELSQFAPDLVAAMKKWAGA